MESQLQTLSKIFTERILRIPDYQRGYAWNEKQIKDFWYDLIQLQDNKNHYVGVLTLENVPKESMLKWEDDLWIINSKSFEPFYVVDGQQRLTTSIILIQTIVEHINSSQKINYTSKEEIAKKFIFDSKDEGISRSYIFGYEKDNPSYQYLITKIFNEKSEKNFPLQETIYTTNLETAKKYFMEKLNEMQFEEIELLYKKLTQHFMFNVYTISTDIDVYITFETMNNRGKPLSNLELLKNRLIYLSTQYESDESEKERLRTNINECWMAVYHYLGKNKIKPLSDDEFLLNHFIFYFNFDYQKEESSDEIFLFHRRGIAGYQKFLLEKKFIQKNIKDIDKPLTISFINDYVRSLKSSVTYWYYINNPLDSQLDERVKSKLVKLNRLLSIRESQSNFERLLILVFLQHEENIDKQISFLDNLERFRFLKLLFRMPIYEMRRLTNIDEINLAIKLFSNRISSEFVINEIKEAAQNIINDKDVYHQTQLRYKKEGFYSWPGIKYFLYEYETTLKKESKSDEQKLEWEVFSKYDNDTIEHIYPQKPVRDYWSKLYLDYSTVQKNLLKNSLGNLVPLSRGKNSSLSNKSFPAKKGNRENTIGFRYGSYSEIEISQVDDWTAEEILTRGIKLLKFMEKNWNIKIGNGTRNDKVTFLGLDFLSRK